MTTALEIGGAFLLAPTLLAAATFLAAFQLGRLITRDDEQREVEAAGVPRVAVHDLLRWPPRRGRRRRAEGEGPAPGRRAGARNSPGEECRGMAIAVKRVQTNVAETATESPSFHSCRTAGRRRPAGFQL
jgi:hypothetical protein